MVLSLPTALAVGLAGLLLGVALGCTSVGGVLLVPRGPFPPALPPASGRTAFRTRRPDLI